MGGVEGGVVVTGGGVPQTGRVTHAVRPLHSVVLVVKSQLRVVVPRVGKLVKLIVEIVGRVVESGAFGGRLVRVPSGARL